MKVSIVIPVYNVEKYLARCIQSVINQTYENIEIILVDDGSMDSSGKLCDTYKMRDNRIKVIHQRNLGVSAARNVGLDLAEGDSITFIDADDYVAENYIETLVNLMKKEKAEISILSYKMTSNYNTEIFKMKSTNVEKIYTGKDACRNMMLARDFDSCVCCKLVNRDVIGEKKFDTNFSIGEDLDFFYRVFLDTKNVVFKNQVGYAYFQHNSNTINRITKENLLSLAKIENLFELENDKRIKTAATCKFISTCFHLFLMANEDKNYLWHYIKKYRKDMIFSRDVTLKVRMACCATYFGFGTLWRIGFWGR